MLIITKSVGGIRGGKNGRREGAIAECCVLKRRRKRAKRKEATRSRLYHSFLRNFERKRFGRKKGRRADLLFSSLLLHPLGKKGGKIASFRKKRRRGESPSAEKEMQAVALLLPSLFFFPEKKPREDLFLPLELRSQLSANPSLEKKKRGSMKRGREGKGEGRRESPHHIPPHLAIVCRGKKAQTEGKKKVRRRATAFPFSLCSRQMGVGKKRREKGIIRDQLFCHRQEISFLSSWISRCSPERREKKKGSIRKRGRRRKFLKKPWRLRKGSCCCSLSL